MEYFWNTEKNTSVKNAMKAFEAKPLTPDSVVPVGASVGPVGASVGPVGASVGPVGVVVVSEDIGSQSTIQKVLIINNKFTQQ